MKDIPIYIINLKKDTERREKIETLCKKYQLNYTFVEAVYGKDLSQEEIDNVYNKERALENIGRELSLGEIGCALSHLKVYKKILNEKIPYALILEDDVVFDNKLKEALLTIDDFPEDWECVLLCYYRNTPVKRLYCLSRYNRCKINKMFKIVRFTELMHSTAGYLINISGAKRLIDELNKGIYLPIDHYTGDENFINLYGLLPKPIDINYEVAFQSTLKEERMMIDKGNSSTQKPDGIREVLKKMHLFYLFKKINLLKMKMQQPITQVLYCLLHINLYFQNKSPYNRIGIDDKK